MCKALEELRMEGVLQGRTEGIRATVKTCKKFQINKEAIIETIGKEFSMPEKDKAVLEEICKAYNIKAEDLIRQFYLWVIREPEAAAQWLKGENNRKNAQRLFYSGGKEKISKK